jgi:hypothetical protein
VDILDEAGATVNSYSSGAMPRQGAGGFFGRRGPPPPTVTTDVGHNRMVWNVQDQDGLTMPPGRYQARLTVEGESQTQPFNVLIDPRVAERGVTVADLAELYEHNRTMNAMVAEVGALVERVRTAQDGGDANLMRRLQPLADRLITGPVRYAKPGLEDHITYLRSMTLRGDKKLGLDAVERYQVLRGELDQLTAEINRVLGTRN